MYPSCPLEPVDGKRDFAGATPFGILSGDTSLDYAGGPNVITSVLTREGGGLRVRETHVVMEAEVREERGRWPAGLEEGGTGARAKEGGRHRTLEKGRDLIVPRASRSKKPGQNCI